MNLYYRTVNDELDFWQLSNSMIRRGVTSAPNERVPKNVEDMIVSAVKELVQNVLSDSIYTPDFGDTSGLSLAERDYLVLRQYERYKNAVIKISTIGDDTILGCQNYLLNLTDFPALLEIQKNFLFDCTELYGNDVNEQNERLFLLYIFLSAFTKNDYRAACYEVLIKWGERQCPDVAPDEAAKEYFFGMDLSNIPIAEPSDSEPSEVIINTGLWLMERLNKYAMNACRLRKIGKTNLRDESRMRRK